uniref:Transposase insD for insertion element IS2A/D/F/H/I/K n=1 Tax=Curvibacter symbiont subsp. Hydra magnipapillata TaxID=667019 RepID=C9Y8V8_CURXX|nr:Transposase insD for insertion element IS2A/D/F/H/I/K [Curvibacter putative symbiont of Hydra magnipapillata]
MDCALASIARGRAVRAVCVALSVYRSHVLARRDRPSKWIDLRKSPPRSEDVVIKQAIANVANHRATYGYRRVWARLRLEGHDLVNHKRVYRVMRDEGWLLYRHGYKPVDTRKHDGTVTVKDSDVRWCSDGLELSCDNGEKVRLAFALDCCDREVMSWVATTKGIDAALVGDLTMQAVESRFGPDGKPLNLIEWLTETAAATWRLRPGALPSNWGSSLSPRP